MIISNYKEPKRNKTERVTRIGFYQRARYSYAIVVKENMKENTKEFTYFKRGKLSAKWIKKIFSPHFNLMKLKQQNKYWLEDTTKNQDIVLHIYFYNYGNEAHDILMGMIAKDRLDQTIQTLNDWTNETLNTDCELREKVKALLDIIDSYKADYELVSR